jgi:peptide chain release factor 1
MSDPISPHLADRLAAMEHEYADLEARLADPEVASNPGELRTVSMRYHQLTPVVTAAKRQRALLADAEAARELLVHAGDDDRTLLEDDLATTTAALDALAEELAILMIPPDPYAGRNVIVEIRGAEGGEEANLFARDLYDMYVAYAGRQGLKVETLDADTSDLGGLNSVTFTVSGEHAWPRFKYEGGGHRVQRVPVTESQGRIHTSSATVLVLPEADEVDVQIDDKDLQIDVFRSSGPGGQSVNTTDSAVRITHIPTGIVISCQDEKSQHKNRAKGMKILRARLLERKQEEQRSEIAASRKLMVGSGDRSERIRTYNFPQGRLTDHRINLTIYQLDRLMEGQIDEVVEALITHYQAEVLKAT